MNNLKTIPDQELITNIRKDAQLERCSGLNVIHQLREIARRRLDAKLGYSSLHKYCMEDLKYSPGSAWRRIKAMQALQDLPELETKIAQGDLTLANVSQIQNFCDQKDKSPEEKKAIFEQVEGLSKREVEKKLAEIAPEPERPDKKRELDGLKTELRITLDAETIAALDKIKDLIAHAVPNASYSEIIARLAQIGLQKLDPAAEKRKYRRKTEAAGNTGHMEKSAEEPTERLPAKKTKNGPQKLTATLSFPPAENYAPPTVSPPPPDSPPQAAASPPQAAASPPQAAASPPQTAASPPQAAIPPSPTAASPSPSPETNTIPAATRRLVWQRDRGICTYKSPETGKACEARALVQPDHIIPRAKGGSHEPNNLRLRCRSHNLLAAIEAFGAAKMSSYLKS